MNANDLQSQFERVRSWSRRQFPNQTLDGILEHMAEEVHELRENPADRSEVADVGITLLHFCALADITPDELLEAIRLKMDVNERRRWQPADANGVHHHVGGRGESQIPNLESQIHTLPRGFAQAAVVDKQLALAVAALRDMVEEGDFQSVNSLALAVAQRAKILTIEARADEAGVVKGGGL